ncbi:thioesterase-like superfamily-domain-containing protein [Plectosphaerella plurivora]|uniref:Thioesterase-like superfamily-domain-containing protein n=1 Tax=Plectosphaerella plurivora TaxID=936078 RepID=A0A9P9ACR6_9PEZI|nr:thioesterase-like superfamily-domain-containing protein [Plectosphaerella plurivora]
MNSRTFVSRVCRMPIGRHAQLATGRRTFASAAQPNAEVVAGALSPRWLTDLQTRLKKVSVTKLSPASGAEWKRLHREIDSRWLDLLAGSDGFLTSPRWRGLNSHAVAWGDMDSMGHVNNVIYNKYAESARVEWVRKFTEEAALEHKQQWTELMSPRGIGLIMRSIKTEYKLPVTYPDRVTVLHRLTKRPDASSDALYFDVMILSDVHRRLAARCSEDIVVYDYRTAKRSPLLPFMVERLQETFDLQEENRTRCREEVRGMFDAVERMERESS